MQIFHQEWNPKEIQFQFFYRGLSFGRFLKLPIPICTFKFLIVDD